MEILTLEEFFKRTIGGRPSQVNITPYLNKEYQCGCGQTHKLSEIEDEVIRELPNLRVVVKSNRCGFVNCIKISGFFKIKLKTLFATEETE